jgi:ribosome-associated translation inhibitor RaiA
MTRVDAIPQPQVHVHGPVRAGLVQYAREKVINALRLAPRPVLFVRIGLNLPTGAAGSYTVRVHADVSGVDLHASASASTFTEAVDLAQRRLRTLLSKHSRWR